MKRARIAYPAEIRAEGEGRKITGKAAVFNMLSEDLGGFREQIIPGAFAKTLSEGGTKKAYWNHNSDYVLGSTKAGTLTLDEREDGLHFEIDPPVWADSQLESIRRGDVDQMSFGFRTLKDRWSQTSDGLVLRELLEVQLYEVSPVAMPAYPQTDAQARSIPDELLPVVATGSHDKQWQAEIRACITERDEAHHSQPDPAPLTEPDQGTTAQPDDPRDIDDRMAVAKLRMESTK